MTHPTLSEAAVEAAARHIYFCQFTVMHDHEQSWQTFKRKNLYLEMARAALTAALPHLQSGVPEGWKVVPIRQDSNMLNSARTAYLTWQSRDNGGSIQELGRLIWEHNLDAAPQAPAAHLQGWQPSEGETVNAKLADALRSLLHLAQASNSTEQDWNDAVDAGFAALASDEASPSPDTAFRKALEWRPRDDSNAS